MKYITQRKSMKPNRIRLVYTIDKLLAGLSVKTKREELNYTHQDCETQCHVRFYGYYRDYGKHHKHHHANTLNNLDGLCKFFKRHKRPKLI